MDQQKIAKVILLDEVNCVVHGLEPRHVKYFNKFYAKKVEGYYFSPLYKLGKWDGTIKFFMKTGKTYINLLPEILPKIRQFEYKIQLDDRRVNSNVFPNKITDQYFAHILDPETQKPIILRDYQVDLVNVLLEEGGGIGIAATGAGKTFMVTALVDCYGKHDFPTMTIVPSQDLITQTKRVMEFLGLDVGEYSGDTKDLEHLHVVSTWQALQNNPTILSRFKVVVVDECHGAKAKILNDLLIQHGANIVHRFGVTGTLPKNETDAMSIQVALGDVKYEINAKTLIDQDYLAKLHINIFQLEEDLTAQYDEYLQIPLEEREDLTYKQFKDAYFPEHSAEKRYLQSNKARIQWIADLINTKRDMKKGNIFCLVGSIQFGKKLTKLIPGAIFVHGPDDKDVRQQVYSLFKDNDNLVVIATVHIAGTGLDIKRIFNLMLIDLGRSFIRTIQTIGRGLRKAEDKDFVDVSDVCSDLKYSRTHVRERMKFYREAGYPFKKIPVKYE